MSAPNLDKTPIVVRIKRSVKRDLKKLAKSEHEPTVNSLLATLATKAATAFMRRFSKETKQHERASDRIEG